MKKFFLILGILFVISLLVTMFAGNITWKNVKDTGTTVKKSFLKVSKTVNETSVKIKDTVLEKIEEMKQNRKKK